MNLSNHHWDIGKLLQATGKPAEALESCERALAIRRRLAEGHPADPGFLNTVADYHNDIGFQEQKLGRLAEAIASWEQARVIREGLTRNHPESPDFACGLAGALSNMAEVDLDAKRFDEARARLRRAIALQKKALAKPPRASHQPGISEDTSGRAHQS